MPAARVLGTVHSELHLTALGGNVCVGNAAYNASIAHPADERWMKMEPCSGDWKGKTDFFGEKYVLVPIYPQLIPSPGFRQMRRWKLADWSPVLSKHSDWCVCECVCVCVCVCTCLALALETATATVCIRTALRFLSRRLEILNLI